MSDLRPFECRWIKQRIPGSFKLMLQQCVPTGLAQPLPEHEWIDVPVISTSELETTQHMPPTRSSKSGPQDAVTGKTTMSALEPILQDPDQIERQIERLVMLAVPLMKARSEMSSFPPYDGTLVLVHGTGKQRMFVNGFERTMPPRAFLIIDDRDVHKFQTDTVAPADANNLPKKAP